MGGAPTTLPVPGCNACRKAADARGTNDLTVPRVQLLHESRRWQGAGADAGKPPMQGAGEDAGAGADAGAFADARGVRRCRGQAPMRGAFAPGF